MRKINKNISILFFVIIVACGYSPLNQHQDKNFNIIKQTYEGDRKINNYISNSLKKYSSTKNANNNYKINISSDNTKDIVNKDSQGNPKNFHVKVSVNLIVISSNGNEIENKFERTKSISSQNKKIDEKKLEQKSIKDLSILISKDIIFYLNNM